MKQLGLIKIWPPDQSMTIKEKKLVPYMGSERIGKVRAQEQIKKRIRKVRV